MIPTETASPLSPAPSVRPGRGRLLAGIAVAAIAAVAITLGIILLVSGRSAGLDAAAGYVPADSFFYLEAQLDLPDGQREKLRTILEQFPAVTADDLLGPALADTLDEALASGNAPFSYSGDIAPWFTGRVAVSINSLPSGFATGDTTLPPMAFLFGTGDAAAAGHALDAIRSSLEGEGVTFTSADRDGVTLWSAESPAGTAGPEPTTFEIAVSADQVILGVNGGGATALDVHAGKADALAQDGDLAQLIARLPKARAATLVINTRAVLEMSNLPSPLPSALAAAIATAPDAGVASISFEADAMRMDVVSGPLADDAPNPVLARDLAAEIPADALVFVEAPGFGDAIGLSVESLKATAAADPATAAILDQLTQVESALGVKLEDYFDWAGGMAFAIGQRGNEPWGGALFEVGDAALAAQRVDQLDALLALAATDPASGIQVTHPALAGTTFTSARIAGSADAGLGLPVGDLVFEYGLTDDRVLIGFGDAFIGRVVGLAAGDSLSGSEAYARALAAVGDDPSHGMVFVDLDATRTWAETLLPPEIKSTYDQEIGPNLEPFDYLAAGSRTDGRFVITTMLLALD